MNHNGEILIEMCQALNLKIVNGRFGTDKGVGKLTFNSNQGNSTIDYFIVSTGFIQYIHDFEVDILDKYLSDFHSPIVLSLKTLDNYKGCDKIMKRELPYVSDVVLDPIYTKWDKEKENEYKAKLDESKLNELLLYLDNMEGIILNKEGIDNAFKMLCNVYIDPGLKVKMSKRIICSKKSQNKKCQNRKTLV